MPRDPSLDCALNRLSRPLSKPDSKFSSQKQGGSKRSHLATQEWLREHSGLENRLLSALIWNLGGHFKIIARFAGLITFFAEAFQPGSCPDQPFSPGIPASQQVFSKQGGLSDRVSRRRSGFPDTLARTCLVPESFLPKFAMLFFQRRAFRQLSPILPGPFAISSSPIS